MSDTSMGPGWWQASDLKWYPPEERPQTSAPPAQRPAAAASYGATQAHQSGGPGLPAAATLQKNLGGVMKRLSLAAWLIAAGAIVAAISSFFPWVQGTTSDGLGDSYSQSLSMNGVGRFLVIAACVGIGILSLPVLAGTVMSKSRKIGLTVVVGAFSLMAIVWTASAVSSGKSQGIADASIGFGTLLCWLALIAIWVGVVLTWTAKSTTPATAG